MSQKFNATQVRSELQRLTKKLCKGKNSLNYRKYKEYIRVYIKHSIHWSPIEEAVLKALQKKEHEKSRSAMVRKAIHERGLRVLGERYYEIIENPSKFFIDRES